MSSDFAPTHDYLVRRFRAGYESRGGSYAHEPCGLMVSAPEVHDPLCPANGRGRITPTLADLTPADA